MINQSVRECLTEEVERVLNDLDMLEMTLTRLLIMATKRAVFIPQLCFLVACLPFCPFRVKHLERFFPNGLSTPTVMECLGIDTTFNPVNLMDVNMPAHHNPRDPFSWIRPANLPVRVRANANVMRFYDLCASRKIRHAPLRMSHTVRSPALSLLAGQPLTTDMFLLSIENS